MSPPRLSSTDRDISVDELGERLLWLLFRDQYGLTIFIASLVFFSVYWRIGFFSTDNYAVVNGLVALADGHLYIERIVFGPPSGATPGMHVVEDRLYARNYGMIAAALPIYFVLQTLNLVADLRLAVVGMWCFGLLIVLLLLTRQSENQERLLAGGSVLILGVFWLNSFHARPFPAELLAVFALQIVTAVSAGLIGVMMYRLGADMYTRRVGVFAGCLVVFASPVGFWATIPKRHSVTALLAIATIFVFYRSRVVDSLRSETRLRAIAYAGAAITAWVHAAEGLVLLSALVSVDVFTARSNHPRQLAVIGCVFLVALSPFLVTNAAINDDPLTPPRELSSYNGDTEVIVEAAADPVSGAGAAPAAGGDDSATDDTALDGDTEAEAGDASESDATRGEVDARSHLTGLVGEVVGLGSTAVDQFAQFTTIVSGNIAALTDYDRLNGVFIRGGFLDSVPIPKAINLTVIEAMPLLGTLVGLPVVAGGWFRRYRRRLDRGVEGVVATDGLVVVYGLLLSLLYLDRLPLHHMFTVRYLHALYPLGAYLVIRSPAVREVIDTEWTVVVTAYLGVVGVGIPGFILVLDRWVQVQGEAVQLYGLIALGVAVVMAMWAVSASLVEVDERVGGLIVGGGMGVMTVYLIVSGLGFFAYTPEYVLPVSEVMAEQLRFINPWSSLWEISADLYQLSP